MTDKQRADPGIDAAVKDTRTGRAGVVVGIVGGRIQLRPFAGGLEWEVKADSVEVLSAREELTARLAALKAEAGRGVWSGPRSIVRNIRQSLAPGPERRAPADARHAARRLRNRLHEENVWTSRREAQ